MTATATEDKKSGADRVSEFLGGRPARTGAELVKALRLSGTPGSKLEGARKHLDAAREAGSTPTAAETLAMMEQQLEAGEISPGTLMKARSIVASGKIRPPARQAPAIEDVILAESEPRAASTSTKKAEK